MNTRLIHKHQPLALAVALALAVGSAQAANITVSHGDDAGTASTCTLRQAIVSSNIDDATGSSCVAGNGADVINFDASLSGATITLGGSRLEVRDSTVVINGSKQIIDANHASRVLLIRDANVTLSNLALTGGGYPTTGSEVGGGGIWTSNSDVSLINVVVSGNATNGGGGGIASFGASLTLINSIVSGNLAGEDGGGIVAELTQLDISDSTIADNQLDANRKYGAGGIKISGSSGTIRGSTISGNSVTIRNTKKNQAGGVYIERSSISMSNCTVSGNSAIGSNSIAGGVSNSYDSVDTEKGFGLTLINTTISGNTASASSGVSVGGLRLSEFGSGSRLENTILSGNVGGTESDLSASSGTPTASHSLLGTSLAGSFDGNGNVFSDSPGLGALSDNGGTTFTMALQPGSPAIDAGDNALILSGVQSDQRGSGYARLFNGVVDMGAIEASDGIFIDGFDRG